MNLRRVFFATYLKFRHLLRILKGFLFLFLYLILIFYSFQLIHYAASTPSLTFSAQVSYEGEFLDSDDTELTVKLYKDTLDDDGLVFSETLSNVTFDNGFVTIEIGTDSTNALDPDYFNSAYNWVLFDIDDDQVIVTINTVTKTFYSFETSVTPTGNLIPTFNTTDMLMMTDNDGSEFTYVSTSNLLESLNLSTVSTLDQSYFGTELDLDDINVSSNYWDQALTTANNLSDTLLTQWDEASSLSIEIDSNSITYWNDAYNDVSLFPSTTGSSDSIVMVNSDGSEFLYVSSSNIFNILNLGQVSLENESDLGTAYNVGNLVASGNLWDASYATFNIITVQMIQNWNEALLTANTITSTYNASSWNEMVTSMNLITSDYNSTQWDTVYNFFTTFNTSANPGFLIFKDNEYITLSTTNALGIDSAETGLIYYDGSEFSVSTNYPSEWDLASETLSLLPTFNNKHGYVVLINSTADGFNYYSTANWNNAVATANLLTPSLLTQWDNAYATANYFPLLSTSPNQFVSVSDISNGYTYTTTQNLFDTLQLGSLSLLDLTDLASSSNVDDLITSANVWDSALTTMNQLSSADLAHWQAALASANLFVSSNLNTGYALIVSGSATTISSITTSNWNLAYASTNILSVDYLSQLNNATSTSNLFPAIPSTNSSFIYFDSASQTLSFMTTSNLVEFLDLGTAAFSNISDIGSSDDISVLMTSSNYWDAAYATFNKISATNISDWQASISTMNQITPLQLTQWNAAYATLNQISSENISYWNMGVLTANQLTSSFISQLDQSATTANYISSTDISQWDAAYATLNRISSIDLVSWNQAFSSSNQLTSTVLSQWNQAYTSSNLVTSVSVNSWIDAYATLNQLSTTDMTQWDEAYDFSLTFDGAPIHSGITIYDSSGYDAYIDSFGGCIMYGPGIYSPGCLIDYDAAKEDYPVYYTVVPENIFGDFEDKSGLIQYNGTSFSLISNTTSSWNMAISTANLYPTFNVSHHGFVHSVDDSNNSFTYVTTANWNAAYSTANQLTSDRLTQWDAAYATMNLFPMLTNQSGYFLVVDSAGQGFEYLSTSNIYSLLELGSAATVNSSMFGSSADESDLLASSNYWDAMYITANLITESLVSQWNDATTQFNRFPSFVNYSGYLIMVDEDNDTYTYVSTQNWNESVSTLNQLSSEDLSFWNAALATTNLFPDYSAASESIVFVNNNASGYTYVTSSNLFNTLQLGSAALSNTDDFGSSSDISALLTDSYNWEEMIVTANKFTTFSDLSDTSDYQNYIAPDLTKYNYTYYSTDTYDNAVLSTNLIISDYNASNWNDADTPSQYFAHFNTPSTHSVLRFDGFDYVPQDSFHIYENGYVFIGTTPLSETNRLVYVDGATFADNITISGNLTASEYIVAANLGAPYDSGSDNSNVYLGYDTGQLSGKSNLFIGQFSGHNLSDGGYNTLLGHFTGYENTTASYNVFIGYEAGYSTTTGDSNTFIGYQSGYNNETGTGNIFIGYQSGYYETGSNRLYISNNQDTDNKPTIYGNLLTDQIGIGTTSLGSYSLSVIGDGLFNDDLYIKNNLIVSQNAQITDHLYVHGDTFLNDTLTVDNVVTAYQDVIISENLYVYRYSYLYDDAYITSQLLFSNNTIRIGQDTRTGGSNNIFIGSYAGYGSAGNELFYLSHNPSANEDSFQDTSPTLYANLSTDQVAIGTTYVGDYSLFVSGNSVFSTDLSVSGNVYNYFSYDEQNTIYASYLIDLDDTDYFIGENSSANNVIAHYYSRNDFNKGHLIGLHQVTTNAYTYTNPIYTIGSSYNPTSVSINLMQGIGYSHSSSYFLSSKENFPSGWGLYVASGNITSTGNASIFLGSNTGQVWAETDIRAPLFYDTDDINLYIDPTSSSIINSLGVGNTTPSDTTVSIHGNAIMGNQYDNITSAFGLTLSSSLSGTYSWGDESDITSSNRLLSINNDSNTTDSHATLSLLNNPSGDSSEAQISLTYPDSNLIFSLKDQTDVWNDVMQLSADGTLLIDSIISIATTNITYPFQMVGTARFSDLVLNADTDNVTESDHPYIQFIQDGGSIEANIGFFGSTNPNEFTVYHLDNYDLTFGAGNTKDHLVIDYTGDITIPNGTLTVSGDIHSNTHTNSSTAYTEESSVYDLNFNDYSNSSIDIASAPLLNELQVSGNVYWSNQTDPALIYFSQTDAATDDGSLNIEMKDNYNEEIYFTQGGTTQMEIDSSGDIQISNDLTVEGDLYLEGISFEFVSGGTDWILYDNDNFNGTTDEWSGMTSGLGSVTTDSGLPFLGHNTTLNGVSNYGFKGTIYKTFTLPSNISHIRLTGSLLMIDSWDVTHDGDYAIIKSDGYEIYRTTKHYQSGIDITGNSYNDNIEHFDVTYYVNGSTSITIHIQHEGNQGVSDESLGLANFNLYIK